jgi:hypothetical protein
MNNSCMPATVLNRSLAWASDRAGLGWANPYGLSWAQPQKNKKIKTKKNRKCRNKNFACLRKNLFLSIYSLISRSGNKKITDFFF